MLIQIRQAPAARNQPILKRLAGERGFRAMGTDMLMFDTELRPSRIHGIGVFLLEPVQAGDVVWRFDSRIDQVFSAAELSSLPTRMQRFLKIYSTFHDGMKLWVLCGDNGRHFNHSDTPNTVSQGIAFGDDVAGRDLAVGTELTSDYATICDSVRMSGANFGAVRQAVG